jgi:hypothetical protein
MAEGRGCILKEKEAQRGRVMKLTKWDKEILDKLALRKKVPLAKFMKKEYTELREKGLSPENVLDEMSMQTMDTRWIFWLPSARKYFGMKKWKEVV